MIDNGIKHGRIAAYHTASNGAAVRFVQTVKGALRVAHQSVVPMHGTGFDDVSPKLQNNPAYDNRSGSMYIHYSVVVLYEQALCL